VSKKLLLSLCLTIVLIATVVCHADQITLANGDRITGTIKSSDSTTLIIKTEYAGDLSVKWEAVKSISSDQPLYVTSKDGTVLVGNVSTTDSKLEVATTSSGQVAVARDTVQTIRSKSAQDEYGSWGGFLDSGLSLSRGNSDTTNFTLGASAVRSTIKDKTSVFVTSLLAKNKVAGISSTTASAINGGIRYDFNLSDRTFAFAFTNFDHDRFQDLDLRNVIGGGLGYHAIKTPATTLDLFGGASLNQEFYSTGLTRRSGELVLGEALDHKLNASVNLHERLEFYPNLSDIGQYRMVFDTAAITKISRYLSWQVDLSDRYISNPLFGLKGNDLLLTTGVRVTFGKQKGQ
jgi:putative salt-induced outer membrane protein YdiY